MSELLYRVALTKIPKVGAIIAKNLISYCGSAEHVFKAHRKELMSVPNVGEAIATYILKQEVLTWAEKELIFIEKHDIKPLFHTDPSFPQRLCAQHDCPVMLYYKGTADLNHGRIIAIVGTRKPTSYGIHLTEELVEGLYQYNVLIVSGLAYGVDIAAHRKSVILDIPTIGVMGTGLQKVYPHEHRDTARNMCQNGGLLTEYPSDEEPDREHFPMRNRIIAGMCDALVVVETANQGGSMISANVAFDYNKEVFAFPARVHDEKSKGCNQLIKAQKAQLIESAEDIAFFMQWDELDKKKNIQPQLFVELSENEKLITTLLQHNSEGVLIDVISQQTQLNHSSIASLLLSLEFKGVIKSLPGKRYAMI
jgi:DNA processing protein